MKSSRKKSASTWTCKAKGCTSPSPEVPCIHLEALLTKEGGQGSHKYINYLSDLNMVNPGKIDKSGYLGSEQPMLVQYNYGYYSATPDEIEHFKTALGAAGLGAAEVNFMMERCVHHKTITAIAREQGFTSKSTAGYFYRQILKKLKTHPGLRQLLKRKEEDEL